MSLSMSVLITGIKSVDFGLIFYTVIKQLITIGIIILILHCSSSYSFRGESHVHRAKMQPKAAMNTEGSKNRSLKNISTKNRLASPTSVTLPRISSQSKASLKRDLCSSRSLNFALQPTVSETFSVRATIYFFQSAGQQTLSTRRLNPVHFYFLSFHPSAGQETRVYWLQIGGCSSGSKKSSGR